VRELALALAAAACCRRAGLASGNCLVAAARGSPGVRLSSGVCRCAGASSRTESGGLPPHSRCHCALCSRPVWFWRGRKTECSLLEYMVKIVSLKRSTSNINHKYNRLDTTSFITELCTLPFFPVPGFLIAVVFVSVCQLFLSLPGVSVVNPAANIMGVCIVFCKFACESPVGIGRWLHPLTTPAIRYAYAALRREWDTISSESERRLCVTGLQG